MSRLQKVLSRSPPKDGDPALPARPFRYPPQKRKKGLPACRQGEDGRERGEAPCPPSSAGQRRVIEALERASGARGNGFNQQFLLK